MRRRIGLVATLVAIVAVLVGCDPGWVHPTVGTGDDSGSVPGDPPGVAFADVAAGAPTALVDLAKRGFLVYDNDRCTILLAAEGTATRYAGTGTCGDTGDGGPALEAQIAVGATPLGGGLQATPVGNVYFVNTPDGSIRRIDGATGVISTVLEDPQGFIFGMTGEAGDAISYLVERQGIDATSSIELRRLDASGNQLIANLDAQVPSIPMGLVRVAPDHYVTFADDSDGSMLRIDVDHGTPTVTSLGSDIPLLVPEAADSAGNIFGITFADSPEPTGNHVFRLGSDGTLDFIAGTGNGDPGITRQMGAGDDIDLSATAIASTMNGNLLVASGHVVYRLVDPAHAPPV